MAGTTIVQTTTPKKTSISIRPYVDPEKTNMGLEKYGVAVHDGTAQSESLACIEKDGIKRYVTGLNEFAPEVKCITDEKTRKAKIQAIRDTVAQLEKELMANIIDPKLPKDPKEDVFWSQVKLLRPDNSEFWDRIEITCGNYPVFLDPHDPYDLIKIIAIEAGGFSLVAPSFEIARAMSASPKFYLDREESTISTKTELKKLRNRALSELQSLFDTNTDKLRLVAKVLDINSTQYKNSTPNDVIYDNMDRYVNGDGVEKSQTRAAEQFLTACRQDMQVLKIRAIIKDAGFYKMILPKSDGFIYHTKSDTMMGKNPSEVLEYLKNPLNDKILEDLMNAVEAHWNE